MDQIWGTFKVIFSMNLVLLWFIVYASLDSEVLANVEFYPGKYHSYFGNILYLRNMTVLRQKLEHEICLFAVRESYVP